MTDGAGAAILPVAETGGRQSALHSSQARAILRAEQEYERAKAIAEQKKKNRNEVRQRFRHLLPLGELVELAGVKIKVSKKTSGPSFRLRAYLERGHKITAAMRPFVGEPTEYEDWQVKESP